MKATNMPTCKSLKQLVGAPGFEPGASGAQDRQPSSCKSFYFNHAIENLSLSSTQGLWLDVAGCGRSDRRVTTKVTTFFGWKGNREMKPTVRTVPIVQLILDEKNANKGTKRGRELLEKSLGDYGAGRSVVVDRKPGDCGE